MKREYDPQSIEKKWQKIWEEGKAFASDISQDKPKYYILDMFPYPSGAGLHVGHTIGYVGTDVIARQKRMEGCEVLHPMGWDSFGLPAEQYAIRTGIHPRETTADNIATYKRQLSSLGLSYDWDREMATSDPSYYKWTQWIFTLLYKRGLAYEAEMQVNYCPFLGTVLANEEVENGKSKEGGYPVERRPLRQWILKITAYAERLLEDLELLDWPEGVKKLQRHWIGKSDGAIVRFLSKGDPLECFTTRVDTLMGVTFVALSPEHPRAEELVAPEKKGAYEEFLAKVRGRSDLERSDGSLEPLIFDMGASVTHPISGEKIPLFLADYVLMGYGTGAIMGVPAHDERDHRLATKLSLPIVKVYEQEVSDEVIAENGAKILALLEKKGLGEKRTSYRLRDWLFSRQRYWGEPIPILHFEDGSMRALELDELPLLPPEVEDYKPSGDGKSPLSKVRSWVEITDPKTGKKALRETNTMPQWAGSCWYYLRFADPHNKEAAFSKASEKYWLPVDLYVGGVEHAVLHLLYARFWHKVLYDEGLVETKEPFLRLRNQGLVTARAYKIPGGVYLPADEVKVQDGAYFEKKSGRPLESTIEKMSKSKLNGVSPDEIIAEYGADALRLYALFMGPFDQERLWNVEGLIGCRRFLAKVFALFDSGKIEDKNDPEMVSEMQKLIMRTKEFLDNCEFNRAVAAFMEFINAFALRPFYDKKVARDFLLLLNPFVPHLVAECFSDHFKEPLDKQAMPKANPALILEKPDHYVVQIDGKVRASFEASKEAKDSELIALAESQERAQKFFANRKILRRLVVRGKLISFSTEAAE